MKDIKVGPLTGNAGGDGNDFSLDADGDLDVVSDLVRVRQDLVKVFLTSRGSNLMLQNYGTYLSTLPGQRETTATQQAVGNEVSWGVSYLQALQQEIDPMLTDEERISSVDAQMQQNPSDPTGYLVRMDIKVASGDSISLITGS